MMPKKTFFIGLFLGVLLATTTAFGQDYSERRANIIEKQKNARAEIEELTEQILKYEERLELADQKYEALYEKYQNLKNLIALQDQKLQKLQDEQEQISEEIRVTAASLEEKNRELQDLIYEYKQTLSYLYKHGRKSQLALIFSASSINQMLVRSFYLEQFNEYREKQAEEIRAVQKELEKTQNQLVEARSKNDDLLAEIKTEKRKLSEKQEQQSRNVSLLRENRNQIKQKLEEIQQQKTDLNNMLSQLIREEEKIQKAQEEREAKRLQKLEAARKIKDDAKRTKEVAKYSEPAEADNFVSADRLDEIEEEFAQNKGQLPWPVNSRTISEHFGNRRHPVYGTVTPNPGIEIVTDSAASVKVVEDGKVIAIQPFAGYGDVVLVKHGRFITVYGNLTQISVRRSQILEQGDIVGLSGDADSPKGESLFFMIRENNENLNPENWLQQETASRN